MWIVLAAMQPAFVYFNYYCMKRYKNGDNIKKRINITKKRREIMYFVEYRVEK